MKSNSVLVHNGRRFLKAAAAATMVLGVLPCLASAAGMKFGVIELGRVGGALGELWTKAGHEVMFSWLEV